MPAPRTLKDYRKKLDKAGRRQLLLVTMLIIVFGVAGEAFFSVYFYSAQSFYVYIIIVIMALLAYYSFMMFKVTQAELYEVERSSRLARENQQQVQSLINNITDGVLAVNADLKVIIYNAAVLDVLDINVDIKGKKLSQFFEPIDANNLPVKLEQLLADTNSASVNRDLRLKYKDGSTINLFIGIAPIYLGYGKSANNGFTFILRDITREKSLEEERDEFISVVSHELRTPIAISEGNISNAQLITKRGGDKTKVQKALAEAHNQVLFLGGLINDLSTLSRAERGKLTVDVGIINVKSFVNELADNYRPQAEAKGLEFKLELGKNLGHLESSQLYVREVLQNFITNAIKYTQAGSVTLKAEATSKGINFFVIDTGIGISKADQERVFDKFFRSEDYRTREANGTGLGLYVTMKLARLIHADIDVKSQLNKGSTFKVFIPNLGQEQ
ncbi:MAG TPA: PAS domain-containing sensor histidine kinase [Candidatus Saccharimonadales bacterium]|nr:PAS domain-containing sensor histidine kinase [Candidatus Saccharimonadales bacterium]